jgi:hypothetical protein
MNRRCPISGFVKPWATSSRAEPYILVKACLIAWQPPLAGLGAERLGGAQEASRLGEMSLPDEQAPESFER